MYKMVVSSFNRTLINNEEAIPCSTMGEIDKLRRNKKVIFTIMTGDSFKTIIDYNRDFPFIDYIIAFNGGYVFDVLNEKVIFKKNIGVSIVKKVYTLFKDFNMCFYTSDLEAYWGNYKDNYYGVVINNFSDFISNYKSDIYKITVICDDMKQVKSILKLLGDYEVDVNTKIVENDNKFFVELYNKINDKFTGVKKISKLNKICLDDVLAIVCSDSDIDVAKNIGKSVAISNACSNIKKICGEETFSNDEKGVEEVLKKYL